ncbi:hypothetical protein EB241_12710 [Erwinia psidii]|uniref:Uncharacterized protein n=1 Tax=Erwinia psidii TaxID=69224 RepID=A0A3N6SG95_9GAMM|nr:hypothetical protein EB241_12710 [Erwinia psidii]
MLSVRITSIATLLQRELFQVYLCHNPQEKVCPNRLNADQSSHSQTIGLKIIQGIYATGKRSLSQAIGACNK